MGKHSKKLNKMDKILCIICLLVTVYVATVLVFAYKGIYVPDSLTYSLLGTGAGECIVMGAIKRYKTRYGKEDSDD